MTAPFIEYIDPDTLTSHSITLTRAQWTAVLQSVQASFLITKHNQHQTRASFLNDIDYEIKRQLNPDKYGN